MIGLPPGLILNHADFLPNDPLLFIHTFLGKIGNRNKLQQGPQIVPKLIRALKVISGNRRTGKSIGRGSRGGECLQCVPSIRRVKHLVLQIMCNSHWRVQPLPIFLKPGIHPAVPGGKERIVLSKLRLRKHKNPQPIFQRLLENGLSDSRIVSFDHHNQPSFPCRV